MALAVDRLSKRSGEDADLLCRLVVLINDAYATAEEGLWLSGVTRTDPAQTYGAIAGGRVVVAHLDGVLAGTIQTHGTDGHDPSFGTLAVDAAFSGRGVGSALVQRVELEAAALGAKSMRLEVLVTNPPHPHLERLASWYARLGYREVGRTGLLKISPHSLPCPPV